MKNLLTTLLLIITLTPLLLITPTKASMPALNYPLYGYNAKNNICQIKQRSKEELMDESLKGVYPNLRECRLENPEIIFHTGRGILIWAGIFCLIFLFNYIIYPRIKKQTALEKRIFFISDIIIMGIVLFFITLLQHYFFPPHTYHNYGSDFDSIFYMTFIHRSIPMFYGSVYFTISLARGVIIYLKEKRGN